MTLKGWFLLIGLCVVCGMLQVAWRNAVIMKAYDLGDRVSRLERAQTDVALLTTEVAALESPVRLAQVAEERKLELVAWSPLAAANNRLVQLAAEDQARD